MKKKLLALTLCFVLALLVISCEKKENQPPTPQATGPLQQVPVSPGQMPPGQMPPGPMMQGPMSPGNQQRAAGPFTMPAGKSQVVVPDFIKGKWSSAKLILEDKVAKTRKEYIVKLGSDFNVPNSNIKISVGQYLPDFKMEGLTMTSLSNTPNNPALAIKIFENNKQIFPAPGKQWGWLFEKVPNIHPFEHARYGITLKEGVKKG
ncbi:MAG: hypothetical protein A2Y97_00525 [Nitrospirae bacterium RBG_13_39_12]|nr:MAG: hypothetical protein A2Y97_00525 [Nitrospirae bacterium RBG_13_39_12]